MNWILIAFLVKHFVCDFPLQRAYQFRNKGKYGHPGGILHASIHGAGTLVICFLFSLPFWFVLADAVVHYHVDWAKTRLNDRLQLTPSSEWFWHLLGFDQFLHYLTYAAFMGLA